MMNRRTRRRKLAASLTVIALAVSPVVMSASASQASPVPAVVGSDPDVLNYALSNLRTCLSKEGAILDVYYLIDNSRSMDQIDGKEGTDRDGLRFKAVERSLYPLMELADAGTEVNVAGGLFSREGTTVRDWLQIQPGSEGDIVEFATELGSTPAGGGTNWAAGVREAQRQLSQQAQGSDAHCQTLVWVTDGGIDVERDPIKTADGVTELCGVGPTDFAVQPAEQGLMFDLRRAGVVVFGVQLQVSDDIRGNLDEGRISEQDSKFSYFKPVVEGSGPVDASFFNNGTALAGTFNCGAVNEDAQGAVIVISEAGQFAENFEELVACISDSCTIPAAPVLCSGGVCEIPIPQGIAAMEFYAPAGFDRRNVLTPDGSAICLTEGCLPEEESDQGGLIRIPIRNVAGVWQVLTDAPSIRPLLFSGLEIDIDPVEVDPRNPTISVGLRLQQSFGAQFEVEHYRQPLQFSANVRFPSGESRPASVEPEGSAWRLTWGPAEDELRGAIPNEVVVTMQATALGVTPDVPDLPLQAVEQAVQVTQKKLETFPSLIQPEPGETAFFTPIEGLAGVGSATLVFRGPELNNGKICWSPDGQGLIGQVSDPGARPDGTFGADIQIAGQEAAACPGGGSGVVLPKGQEVPVEISMQATEQEDALVTGTMRFELFGPEGEAGFVQEVPFEVETTIVKSDTARNIVLALLTLLGIGVPYLALLFFARRQAAFNSQLDGNRWAALPVTVGPEGLASVKEIDPSKYEFIFVEQSGLTREIATGTETHRVIPPRLWPFKPVRTVVETSSGGSIFTNYDPRIVAGHNEGASSQVLSNVFYFVPDAEESAQTVTETRVDDWGNEIAVTVDSVKEAGAHISGRLIVIASGDGNVTESTSKAVAKARMWPAWPEIYSAIMSTPVVASSAPPVAPAKASQVSDAASGSPTEDWFGFGETGGSAPSDDKPKRSRFGRKKGSDDANGADGAGNGNDFRTDDW